MQLLDEHKMVFIATITGMTIEVTRVGIDIIKKFI